MVSAQKEGALLILNIKRDSSHSSGITNDAVISTEGRNLLRRESLSFPELLGRYLCGFLNFLVVKVPLVVTGIRSRDNQDGGEET